MCARADAAEKALVCIAIRVAIASPGEGGDIIDFGLTSANADRAFKARGGFAINCDTGAGHCGGAPLASDVWRFFQAHPFGVDPEPWTTLPPGFSPECTIP